MCNSKNYFVLRLAASLNDYWLRNFAIVSENKQRFQKGIAVLGLLAFALLIYYWMMPDKNWNGIRINSGQKDEIKLPDGSMAYLIGPSELGFPKSFDEDIRRVKMEGEIYFEVNKNDKKPFLVQSEKGGVETQGANFIINTKAKQNITVHCLTDSARMIARGKTKIFDIKLLANEMSEFWRSDKHIEKRKTDSSSVKKFGL